MPFKSAAQRRLFHAKMRRGEISKATVEHWEKETKRAAALKALLRKRKK